MEKVWVIFCFFGSSLSCSMSDDEIKYHVAINVMIDILTFKSKSVISLLMNINLINLILRPTVLIQSKWYSPIHKNPINHQKLIHNNKSKREKSDSRNVSMLHCCNVFSQCFRPTRLDSRHDSQFKSDSRRLHSWTGLARVEIFPRKIQISFIFHRKLIVRQSRFIGNSTHRLSNPL